MAATNVKAVNRLKNELTTRSASSRTMAKLVMRGQGVILAHEIKKYTAKAIEGIGDTLNVLSARYNIMGGRK